MAQELVITSVRRGLDGGSGYQPVLRTRGMKPALAERLQIRSSYAHPYPHGDKRNPIVFVHRIERIAGQTLHVLGRFCDAGSDHTGRSNFLSHLVVIDEAEARRKSAGPADLARRFSYRKTWIDTPREIEPPALISADRAPGPCEVWRSAGLDPGLAGDLAEAATNGSEVRLILRTQDDALSLFADALTLVPPARRWSVTFNTCEIESFDATWRAAREDLSQAKAWRGSPGVIDLTRPGVCGSNSVYARYARGENVTLPWQTQRSAPDNITSVAESSATVSQAPTGAAAQRITSTRDVPSTPPPPVSSSAPPAGQPLQSPPPTSELPGKRNYLRRVEEEREYRRLHEDDVPACTDASRYVIPMLGALFLGVFIAGFVKLQLNPDLQMRIAAALRDLAPESPTQPRSNEEDNTNNDSADLGEIARTQREQLQKQEVERQKQKEEEEKVKAERLAQAARDENARLAQETERKRNEEKIRQEKEAQVLQRKREIAFDALRQLDGITRQDLPVPAQLDTNSVKAAEICAIDASDLSGLALELAVPSEELPEKSRFRAWVEPAAGKDLTWSVFAAPPTATGDREVKPIELGVLSIRDRMLTLMPSRAEILRSARFSLLRRCVLVIKTVDPRAKNAKRDPVAAASVQLVRPISISDKTVNPFTSTKDSELWEFIASSGGSNSVVSIPENAHIDYAIRFDEKSEEVKRKPDDPSFFPLLQAKDRSGNMVDAWIGVRTTVSKNAMRIAPTIVGSAKHSNDIKRICDALSKTEVQLQEEKNNRIRSLQPRIKKLAKLKPQDFPAQHGQLENFLNQYGRDFGEFVDGQNGIKQWQNNWQSLVTRANSLLSQVGETRDPSKPSGSGREWTFQDVAPQLAEIEREWQTTYAQPLQAWCEEFISKDMADLEAIRNTYGPLAKPLTIQISQINCVALDSKGEEYQVVLAKRDDASAVAETKKGQTGSNQAVISIK